MASIVHVGKLGPRVVHRVVSKQTFGGIRAVFGRDSASDIEHPAMTGHACEADRLIAWHARSVTPVSSACVVHLYQSCSLDGGVGKGMMVAHGVNFVADHGATMVLLCFLKFFDGRTPCLVHDIENLNRFRVGFITCLSRVNVNAAADEEHFIGRWEVSRTSPSPHGHQTKTTRGGPGDLRAFKLSEAGGGRLRQIRVRKPAGRWKEIGCLNRFL